jgi:hypothetical protein
MYFAKNNVAGIGNNYLKNLQFLCKMSSDEIVGISAYIKECFRKSVKACRNAVCEVKWEIPAKMNKTLAIGCATWFDCVIRQDVSILKRG